MCRVILVFSSQEEVENGYKKLNEETISFIQEMVESHQYLPKYSMFHDVFAFEKEHNIQMFHDFMDFEKSNHFLKIETLGKIRSAIDSNFRESKRKYNLYFIG